MEKLVIIREQIESSILVELKNLIKSDKLQLDGAISYNKFILKSLIPHKIQIEKPTYYYDEIILLKGWGVYEFVKEDGEYISAGTNENEFHGKANIVITNGDGLYVSANIIDNKIRISKK